MIHKIESIENPNKVLVGFALNRKSKRKLEKKSGKNKMLMKIELICHMIKNKTLKKKTAFD